MNILYQNDPQRGPGHGLLSCSEASFGPSPFVFNLARYSDHQYLNETDWSVSRFDLEPAAHKIEDGVLILSITPEIVNHLDSQETYRFILKDASGTTLTATLKPKEILYATEDKTGALPPVPSPEPARQRIIEEPEPEPAPEFVPEPEVAPVSTEKKTASVPLLKTRKFWILLLIILHLLGFAGAGIWWFLHPESTAENTNPHTTERPQEPDTPQQDNPKPESPLTPEAPKAGEKPENPRTPENPLPEEPQRPDHAATTPQPEPPVQAPAPVLSVEKQVNHFFRTQTRTPEAAAKLGLELATSTPEEQDAVYRLYYYASENGETSVLMNYAACLDPAMPQWGSISKDAVLAWEIYEKAKATHPEATSVQSNMKNWIREKAGSGDRQARAWLDQLK